MTIDSILPIPELFSTKRILCIQPHYDDNDIAAAGILTQLARNGAELFYLTATNDLMGVIDTSLNEEAATKALRQDQFAAASIVGVKEQYWCGYPDAGQYDYFDLRRDFLKYIRMLKPDLVFAPDAWLTYEGHRDHVQTGLAAVEAVMFSSLTGIASSDRTIDTAYEPHPILGVALYYTREPNYVADLSTTWDKKIAAVRCYKTQFKPEDMDQLVFALDIKSQQVAQGQAFPRGEPLKVLHPSALHCGI
jgi:LmbE family N-acetylglucosaminyl deacetylase